MYGDVEVCAGECALGLSGWVLALIFGHAPWVRVGASPSSESNQRSDWFLCPKCGYRGGGHLHDLVVLGLPLHTTSYARGGARKSFAQRGI
jgi:hypothetical protein